MTHMSKKLIINADDYGICREVNLALENLIKLGKLKNVSVLANSLFFEEAAGFLLNRPDCSIGVHLNIVEGTALLTSDKIKVLLDKNGQFVNLSQILRRWFTSPMAVSKAVELEWRAQIEILLDSGLTLSHADSHQHIHAFPPFWGILVKICRDYEIPAMRFPSERNRTKRRSLSAFALAQSTNISTFLQPSDTPIGNHHFFGFKRAGEYCEDALINDLKQLKEGVTELVLHPSLIDGVPYPELRGELEYQALMGTKIWAAIEELEIELTNWSNFSIV
jgi:predicted glycoside hydrolase/deacetylase ChbG (UPF0249 family)